MAEVILCELVLIFNGNHMICLIESNKIDEIGSAIESRWADDFKNKKESVITVNCFSGKAMFKSDLLYGFYFRPASPTVQEDYRKKLLELMERQTKASEKVSGEFGHGEDWKE